jgi:hypothetical protein
MSPELTGWELSAGCAGVAGAAGVGTCDASAGVAGVAGALVSTACPNPPLRGVRTKSDKASTRPKADWRRCRKNCFKSSLSQWKQRSWERQNARRPFFSLFAQEFGDGPEKRQANYRKPRERLTGVEFGREMLSASDDHWAEPLPSAF